MAIYSDNLLDENNLCPIEGALLYIYTSAGDEATVTDASDQPLTQPITTDEDGGFEYKASDGVYRHDFWKNGRRIYRDNRIIVGNPGTINVAVGAFGQNLVANATAADARADLELTVPSGASRIGSDDGAGGTLWATMGGFVARLLSSAGSASIGTTDGNVQTDINAAKDRLDDIETITPTGEDAALSLADALRPFPAGPREAIIYNDADSVRVSSNFVAMAGFRFRGQYTKGRSPVFAMPSAKVAEYNTTGCPVFSAVKTETWVGVFACANNGDATAVIRTMPFLRLAAPVGSVANLIKGGEGVHNLVTTSAHSWAAANNLAGTDCLVISEGGIAFSGRVTTITANTSTSVTLASIGTIAAGDFILPAPPGFAHYVYLGSFYFDTAEVRNIYDSGTVAMGKMIYIAADKAGATTFLTGSVATPLEINARGYISPLATAVMMDAGCVLSTSSAGDYAEYFGGDTSNHTVRSFYDYKAATANLSITNGGITVPFLYHQTFSYQNAGSLVAARVNGQLNVTGWIEP